MSLTVESLELALFCIGFVAWALSCQISAQSLSLLYTGSRVSGPFQSIFDDIFSQYHVNHPSNLENCVAVILPSSQIVNTSKRGF